MKCFNTILLILLISTSCSKESKLQKSAGLEENSAQITYDTVPIDSFGPGATPAGVLAKINAIPERKKMDSITKVIESKKGKVELETAKALIKQQKDEVKKPTITKEQKRETPKQEATVIVE